MKYLLTPVLFFVALVIVCSCTSNRTNSKNDSTTKIPVILDTDANNELDDQHAIAYMLCNQDVFNIEGITVNTTRNGGLIDGHYDEALRILKLFNEQNHFKIYKGADKSFAEIQGSMDELEFDGREAVDFIIEKAKKYSNNELILLPIGKLTNIALALKKDPEIINNVKVVWLGSNYPEPGEYNLDNDTSALNYILKCEVPFEIVTVSYGRNTGTSNIHVSVPEIDSIMPGLGPVAEESIIGRHGGEFSNFGDYAVNLWHHIDTYGDPPQRSLFDVGAIAIVKNSNWAKSKEIPAPFYNSDGFVDRPENTRKIVIWEYFERDSIVNDLYNSLQNSIN